MKVICNASFAYTAFIQAHLEGYGFHLQNPEAVMRGEKPIVKEVNISRNVFKKWLFDPHFRLDPLSIKRSPSKTALTRAMENLISSMGRMAKHSPTGLGGHRQFKRQKIIMPLHDLSS